MKYVYIFLILAWPFTSAAQQPIRFLLPNFPPYAYLEDEQLKGIAVEKVSKIMAIAQLKYQFKLTTDYDRAIYEVKNDQADGFFLASQNQVRDQFAIFSLPVLNNAWSWFLPKGSEMQPFSQEFKAKNVGTILNTNTHKWLIKNQFTASTGVLSAQRLVKMLDKGRIDAAFLASRVFTQALVKSGKQLSDYQEVVQKVKPFGIYISKSYIAKHPAILVKINQAIEQVSMESE